MNLHQITIALYVDKCSLSDTTRTTKTLAFWDTLCHPMNTHAIDSYRIPSQNKTKSKLQIWKISQNFKFWSCFIRCVNMKWIRLVLLKLQSGPDSVHRRTDKRTDGRTDGRTTWNQYTPPPPFNIVKAGGIKSKPAYSIWNNRINVTSNYQFVGSITQHKTGVPSVANISRACPIASYRCREFSVISYCKLFHPSCNACIPPESRVIYTYTNTSLHNICSIYV